MDDYISRQDAVHTIMGQPPDAHYPSWYAAQIEDISAADVVPVVRCKDCKHCYFADNRVPDEQGWVCEINSSEPVNLNGFCSYGERRKQE